MNVLVISFEFRLLESDSQCVLLVYGSFTVLLLLGYGPINWQLVHVLL